MAKARCYLRCTALVRTPTISAENNIQESIVAAAVATKQSSSVLGNFGYCGWAVQSDVDDGGQSRVDLGLACLFGGVELDTAVVDHGGETRGVCILGLVDDGEVALLKSLGLHTLDVELGIKSSKRERQDIVLVGKHSESTALGLVSETAEVVVTSNAGRPLNINKWVVKQTKLKLLPHKLADRLVNARLWHETLLNQLDDQLGLCLTTKNITSSLDNTASTLKLSLILQTPESGGDDTPIGNDNALVAKLFLKKVSDDTLVEAESNFLP
ncbi:hypothetical protein HG531_008472 [Fusarium graminearum]|nr:hypothetical protein HG531_008472 [Fusarium graminearum]